MLNSWNFLVLYFGNLKMDSHSAVTYANVFAKVIEAPEYACRETACCCTFPDIIVSDLVTSVWGGGIW